jgi:hypothetical protein
MINLMSPKASSGSETKSDRRYMKKCPTFGAGPF